MKRRLLSFSCCPCPYGQGVIPFRHKAWVSIVNGDGDINIADDVHIVNLVAGKIEALVLRLEFNISELQ